MGYGLKAPSVVLCTNFTDALINVAGVVVNIHGHFFIV